MRDGHCVMYPKKKKAKSKMVKGKKGQWESGREREKRDR